jgi:RNA polymerase sigma-70 factor (ECF subfamily)
MEDAALILQLKNDDAEALKALFNRYYHPLKGYLFLLFKNESLAENIAQDIFVYLWENRSQIEIRTSVEAYLYSAGRYRGLNHLRNNKIHEIILQKVNQSSSIGFSPNQAMEMQELEAIIEESILSLPKRCQEIFRLSRFEELNYKEIAERLGISINTVENQMSIALKKLRKRLRPFYLQMLFNL